MQSQKRVYQLQPILDVPMFEGFGSKSGDSIRGTDSLYNDFWPDSLQTRDWKAPRLAGIWRPLEVEGRVRKFNDYPCVNMGIPAFSARAVEALRDLLEPNGELLPLDSDLGSYFAFNVTTVANVLDFEHSAVTGLEDCDDDEFLVSTIEEYEFHEDRLEGLSIFRLPESPPDTFVTNVFESRVREHCLQGFNFIRVWPLPPGVTWREAERAQERKRQRKGLPKGRTIAGNSVILLLPLAGQEPTAAERARVERYLDELDTLLLEREARGELLGSLEGHEYAAGERPDCRIFLSGPDADVLAAALLPWLRNLRENENLRVIKRYGTFTDAKAREERVKLLL